MTQSVLAILKIRDIPQQCDFKTMAHTDCNGDGIPTHLSFLEPSDGNSHDQPEFITLCYGCFNEDDPNDKTDYAKYIAPSWLIDYKL